MSDWNFRGIVVSDIYYWEHNKVYSVKVLDIIVLVEPLDFDAI